MFGFFQNIAGGEAERPPDLQRQTTEELIQMAIEESTPARSEEEEQAALAARANRQAAREAAVERMLDAASFGPFGLVPVEAASLGFEVIFGGDTYSVDTARPALAKIQAMEDVYGFGELSPRAPLQSSKEERTAIGMPTPGACVQYAYPLAGMEGCAYAHELSMAEPAYNLLALGGFLYYESMEAAQPCAVYALIGDAAAAAGFDATKVAGEIRFTGPYSLDPLEIGDVLFNSGRVHGVVDDVIAQRGVKSFGWLAPAEKVLAEDGSVLADGAKWPHGAFVFQYNHTLLDCFFAVQIPPPPKGAAPPAHAGEGTGVAEADGQVAALRAQLEAITLAFQQAATEYADMRKARDEAEAKAQRLQTELIAAVANAGTMPVAPPPIAAMAPPPMVPPPPPPPVAGGGPPPPPPPPPPPGGGPRPPPPPPPPPPPTN